MHPTNLCNGRRGASNSASIFANGSKQLLPAVRLETGCGAADLLEYGSEPWRHWTMSALGFGVDVVAAVARVRTILSVLSILPYLALEPRDHVRE
jgi:hypothetical protein